MLEIEYNSLEYLNREYNKYFKWYWNICERAKDRILPDDIYIERHHVYPKSIYGENKFLVKLTAKEHYIVHLCLWFGLRQKFCKSDLKTIKMGYACSRMIKKSKRVGCEENYNSRNFELLRIAFNESNKEYYKIYNPSLGRKHTQETKDKMSASAKIKNLGKKHTQETKDKMSDNKINKPKTIEHNLKNSISCKKRIMSEETKNKISETVRKNAKSIKQSKRIVYEYDLNYNLIKIYNSRNECNRYYNKRLGDVYIVKNTKLIEENNFKKLRIYDNKILTYKQISVDMVKDKLIK